MEPVSGAEHALATNRSGGKLIDVRAMPASERVVRSDFFVWLVTHHDPSTPMPPFGIRAKGLIFNDLLDFSHRSGESGNPLPPIWLHEAIFRSFVSFEAAFLTDLHLVNSVACQGLHLQRCRILNNLFLDNTTCNGLLNIMGSEIAGQLSMNGAQIFGRPSRESGDKLHAIAASGVKIGRGIYCSPIGTKRFLTRGEFDLNNSTIGGGVRLAGARLNSASSNSATPTAALYADGCNIKADLFGVSADTYRFESIGEIRLLGSIIGGQCAFRGSYLKGRNLHDPLLAYSLSLDAASISEGLFLDSDENHQFESEGTVRLVGATIGGPLQLSGASLMGCVDEAGEISTPSFIADGAKISGLIQVHHPTQMFRSIGIFRIPGIVVSGPVELSRCEFLTGSAINKPTMIALNAERIDAAHGINLGPDFSSNGVTFAHNSKIRDILIQGRIATRLLPIVFSHSVCGLVRIRVGSDSETVIDFSYVNAEQFDGFSPLWAGDSQGNTPPDVYINIDGLSYTKTTIGSRPVVRRRRWGRFVPRNAEVENVLEFIHRTLPEEDVGVKGVSLQPARRIAEYMRSIGSVKESEDVAVAAKLLRLRLKSDGLYKRLINWSSFVFFRFGYGPLRSTLWVGAFVLIGTLLFAYAKTTGQIAGSGADMCDQPSIILALDVFLPLIDLEFGQDCTLNSRSSLFQYAFAALSLIGAIFVPLVALTYAGILRSEPR